MSCNEERDDLRVDCINLSDGLLTMDSDMIRSDLNVLLGDLGPEPVENDDIGHRKNIDIFINRVNVACSNLKAELLCYACIKTYPPQSEIRIEIDTSGSKIYRIIDILAPGDSVLLFVGIHGDYE